MVPVVWSGGPLEGLLGGHLWVLHWQGEDDGPKAGQGHILGNCRIGASWSAVPHLQACVHSGPLQGMALAGSHWRAQRWAGWYCGPCARSAPGWCMLGVALGNPSTNTTGSHWQGSTRPCVCSPAGPCALCVTPRISGVSAGWVPLWGYVGPVCTFPQASGYSRPL